MLSTERRSAHAAAACSVYPELNSEQNTHPQPPREHHMGFIFFTLLAIGLLAGLIYKIKHDKPEPSDGMISYDGWATAPDSGSSDSSSSD